MNDYGTLKCNYCKKVLPKGVPYVVLPVNKVIKAPDYYTKTEKFDDAIHFHTNCYMEVIEWLEHH